MSDKDNYFDQSFQQKERLSLSLLKSEDQVLQALNEVQIKTADKKIEDLTLLWNVPLEAIMPYLCCCFKILRSGKHEYDHNLTRAQNLNYTEQLDFQVKEAEK